MKFIPAGVSFRAARSALTLKKNSPQLLFASGVIGVTASTVLACKATLKLEEVLAEGQADLAKTRKVREDHPEKYSAEDQQKDTAIVYLRTGLQVVKLYGPAIALGLTSVGALTASHRILTQRNVAIGAAYATLDEAFEKYRARVVKKYGKDEDRRMRYESEEIDIIDDETGKVVSRVKAKTDEDHSGYARWFNRKSRNWMVEPEYNLLFLSGQQNYFNDLLSMRGHVFLNEVYDALDMPHTSAGAVVGWLASGPNSDGFIDFGFRNYEDESVVDFLEGKEGDVLLDFNVDGIIYDKIGKRR